MKALPAIAKEPFSIDMLRDQCKVVDRRPGDPVALRKALARLHRIQKTMPAATVDTLADLRRTREKRGHP